MLNVIYYEMVLNNNLLITFKHSNIDALPRINFIRSETGPWGFSSPCWLLVLQLLKAFWLLNVDSHRKMNYYIF